MHALYDLKDMLCKELEEYGGKGELTAGSLDVIDKLAHAIKNVDKIIMNYEGEEYSNRGSYDNGGGSYGTSYRNSYRGDNSYRRGRGRNARRDSMGRYSSEGYSRADDMIEQMYNLMENAPDEQARQEIQRVISKMENR